MTCGQVKETLSKPLMQVLLLCLAVFVVYYPSIFAEVSLLDDYDMLISLLNHPGVNLKELFLPHARLGGYYRPLTMLTYQMDTVVWGQASVIMHFENILLHLFVALMVLWLGNLLFAGRPRQRGVAFAAALVFALHPLATESVDWISGRTDILAGDFMFLGLCLYLVAERKGGGLSKAGALLIMVLGCFAKETAFASLLVLPMIVIGARSGRLLPDAVEGIKISHWFVLSSVMIFFAGLFTFNYWLVLVVVAGAFVYYVRKSQFSPSRKIELKRDILAIMLFSVVGMSLFWLLRKLAYVSDFSRLGQTISAITRDWNYTFHLFLGAFGFYVKKFFLPLPLNIAIREIDPVYSLFGGIVILGALYLLANRSLFSSLVLSGLVLVVPALPFTFGTIAWTAYAERYEYLAAPFWILALGCLAVENVADIKPKLLPAISILLSGLAVVTFQRNLIWQTNTSLFADSVKKSPRFRPVRGLYMMALYKQRNYNEAVCQYEIAQTLPTVGYDDRLDVLYAHILAEEGNNYKAATVYLNALNKSHGKSVDSLKGLVSYYEYRSYSDKSCFTSLQCYLEKLVGLTDDPYYRFKLANLYLKLGKIKDARYAFAAVSANSGVDVAIRRSAMKMLENIRGQQ